MLRGEPRLYTKYSDGILIEAGHYLLRKGSLLRFFHGKIAALDPRTPIFQVPNDSFYDQRTEKIRTSYLKLASLHGEPILGKFIKGEPVTPDDFKPGDCKKLAVNASRLERTASPEIFLPPYFSIGSSNDPWIPVNIEIFREVKKLEGTPEAYFPLAFDHRVLEDPEEIDAVCRMTSGIDSRGYAIWPVGLDEFHSSVGELQGLAHLLSNLAGSKVLMYAGYFSILLCALTGSSFSNGPCFYEKRDITISPPLEFRPRCRYYLPLIHQKVDPVAALALYRILGERGISPSLCKSCRKYVQDGDFTGIAEMPDINIFEHNFLSRRKEVELLRKSRDPLELGLENLRFLERIRDELSHIRQMRFVKTWIEALEPFQGITRDIRSTGPVVS